jgi:xanthine dehydrogenase large subunit
VLERSLFHSTASYHVPNVRVTGLSCRTNLAPFTAFRGFGGPQAMFVFETAVDAAARTLGVARHRLQRRNLLREDSVFPYGMRAEGCRAERCWDEADRAYDLEARVAAAAAHNATTAATKKGVAVMPVCFGISFTNTSMNQAGALVHVYTDGSVGVSTGAVEMGQGVNQKIRLIVAQTLGVDLDRVRVETTNTTRVANTSPTAASTGADLNGAAAKLACEQIVARLRAFAPDQRDWSTLVAAAHLARIDLSAHAFYATPGIHFDKAREKGRPFAYHVYGTAIVEVTLDVLRGTSEIDAVRLVHDGGNLIDETIDRGQVEGALAQGLGWMLLEEVRWDPDGRLLHDTAGKYKVPDLGFLPDTVEVAFLQDAANSEAVLGSKAVGEPPLMYGIGAFFALRQAIAAAGGEVDAARATAPLTPERTMALLTRTAAMASGSADGAPTPRRSS